MCFAIREGHLFRTAQLFYLNHLHSVLSISSHHFGITLNFESSKMLSTATRLVFFFLLLSLLIAKSSAASFACNNDDNCAGCSEDGDGNPVDGSNDCYWVAETGNGGECRKKSGHGHCQVNDDDDDDDDDDDYGACCCYHNPGQWEYFCTTPENCEYHGDTCEDISNCESIFDGCKDMDDDDDDDEEALHFFIGLIAVLLPVVLCCCCGCCYYNHKKRASANVHGTPQGKPVTPTFQQPEQHQQQENPKPITLTFQQPEQPELMGLQMTKTPQEQPQQQMQLQMQQQMQPQIAVPMVPALAVAPVAVPVTIMPAPVPAPVPAPAAAPVPAPEAAPVPAPVEMVEVDVPFWGGGTAVSVIYKDRLIMVDVPKDAPPGTKMMLPVPESEL